LPMNLTWILAGIGAVLAYFVYKRSTAQTTVVGTIPGPTSPQLAPTGTSVTAPTAPTGSALNPLPQTPTTTTQAAGTGSVNVGQQINGWGGLWTVLVMGPGKLVVVDIGTKVDLSVGTILLDPRTGQKWQVLCCIGIYSQETQQTTQSNEGYLERV